ncbi:helix-turn-helix domain-containing protein [Streptomyces sp. NPDC002306]
MRELADAVGLSPSTVSHHLTPDAGRGHRGSHPGGAAAGARTAAAETVTRDGAGLASLIEHPRSGPAGILTLQARCGPPVRSPARPPGRSQTGVARRACLPRAGAPYARPAATAPVIRCPPR